MRSFEATAFETTASRVFLAATSEPVQIIRHEASALVLMSQRHYAYFEALEDMAWGKFAQKVLDAGDFLRGAEASMALQELACEKCLRATQRQHRIIS